MPERIFNARKSRSICPDASHLATFFFTASPFVSKYLVENQTRLQIFALQVGVIF